MEIWLTSDAPDDAVDQIASMLDASLFVDQYHYVDRDETKADFDEYYADEPAIRDLVEADQLPTMFEVSVRTRASADELAEELRQHGRVNGVEVTAAEGACDDQIAALREACEASDLSTVGMYVFFVSDAPQRSIDTVGQVLEGSELLTTVTYLDRDDLMVDFKAHYPDSPEVVALTDPEDLPTAWHANLLATADPAAVDQLAAELDEMPDVSGSWIENPPKTDYCLEYGP